MTDKRTMVEALKERGPYLIWDTMNQEEQSLAAHAVWRDSDREAKAVVEAALAKALKFRPNSLRKLPVEKLARRLVLMAPEMPEPILFQYLFYFHMAERRPLMVEYLDAVGVPHEDGVLNLEDDAEPPTAEVVEKAARELLKAHPHEATVYLATLLVADADLWAGVEPVLVELEEPSPRED